MGKPDNFPWGRNAGIFAEAHFKILISIVLVTTAMILPTFSTADAAELGQSQSQPEFGFGGKVKLGHWTPIFIPHQWTDLADTFEFKTIDGDESPVIYTGPIDFTPSSTPSSHDRKSGNRPAIIYVRFGKTFGNIELTLRNGDQTIRTFQAEKSELKRLSFAKSTDLLTVILSGNEDFVTRLRSAVAAQSPDQQRLTVAIDSVAALPTQGIGWQSVNRLILSPASLNDIQSAPMELGLAINQWVKSGGDLIVIADPKQRSLFEQNSWLSPLIPGRTGPNVEMRTSRELERFVGTSRRQLINRDDRSIAMLKVTPDQDSVVVARSDGNPLLIRSALGFGQVSLFTLDLESDRLMNWPSHASLIESVIAEDDRRINPTSRQEAKRSATGLAHNGYTDMLGQLRVPLDDFSTVRFLAFTLIAVLITIYILCVTVGDFFFLRNVLGKMESTWVTFPLITLLFCGLAVGISKATRPSELQINQMEIIDIDLVNSASRGTAWVNLYAPKGEKVDVELDRETSLGLAVLRQVVSWQGLPGDGLGGMGNSIATGFKRLQYQQTITASPNGEANVSIQQLPLQVASTKPLLIQYGIETPINFTSQLAVGRDRLQGTFKNPLRMPIYNGKIFFGDYVYLLKKPLHPDVVTLVESDTKERTLRSYLNRRTATSTQGNEIGRSQNQPWDPNEKNLTRIADVMMFYQAAGGQGYTGLTNGYHREIDFSRLLRLGQAVLVGQIESGSHIKVNAQDVSDRYDSNITMVRVVLPVAKENEASQ
jgi:hypothetical protein